MKCNMALTNPSKINFYHINYNQSFANLNYKILQIFFFVLIRTKTSPSNTIVEEVGSRCSKYLSMLFVLCFVMLTVFSFP